MRYILIIIAVVWVVWEIYSYVKGKPTALWALYEVYDELGKIIMTKPQELPEIPVEEMAGSVKNEEEVKEETYTSTSV